jgi:hypothetical protein
MLERLQMAEQLHLFQQPQHHVYDFDYHLLL